MKAIKKFYGSLKVRNKILFSFIWLMVVTIVLLSAIVISIATKSVRESLDNNTRQMMNQVNEGMELHIKNYENIMDYISVLQTTKGYFSTGSMDKDIMEEHIQTYKESNPEIASIGLVTVEDDFFSFDMKRVSRDPLTSETWYREAVADPDHYQLYISPVGRNVRYSGSVSGTEHILSISKAYQDESGDIRGVIMMDIDTLVFESIIEEAIIGETGFIYIQNNQGDVVYTKRNPVVYHIPLSLFDSPESKSVTYVAEKDYQVTWQPSDVSDWNIVGVSSLEETLEPVTTIQFVVILLTLLLLMGSFVVSYFLSDTITKPIHKLRDIMGRVENGEMDLRFTTVYNDEIGQLGHSFNGMLDATNNLLDMVVTEQKKKKEAELNILREQIKPHFLYNTLDTLHWLIKEGKSKESLALIKALTKLFRISLSKGKDQITIGDELKHIESYMIIQKIRYEDKLNFTIKCEENLKDLRITKLILQPLVENAIYHGIKMVKRSGHIDIGVRRQGKVLEFMIEDNGPGIEPIELNRMNQVLKGSIPKSKEYGLVHVNEKIKLTYGNQYGITIESQVGLGTCVKVTHPVI